MKAITTVALSLSKGASRIGAPFGCLAGAQDGLRQAQGHGSIRKTVIPALLAASILTGMAPGDMSIAAFLARADRVMRFGPLAMATPEAYRLKNEVVATAKRYKARIDAQRRAGQRTTSCPPETGTLTPEQWLAHLNEYPARVRGRISLYAAFDALMKKRYPCPA